MKISEMRLLPDKELTELSVQKNSRGRYTSEANKAMKIRMERVHWDGVPSRPPSFEAMLLAEQGYIDEGAYY